MQTGQGYAKIGENARYKKMIKMAESTETRRENWIRVVCGLWYVQEGLEGYVDTKGKQQYKTFMDTINANCNNQTCGQCQINFRCKNGKKIQSSTFNKGHFCDEMKKEIQKNHVENVIWKNTDSTKWQDPNVGYWEVAKCYLSTAGYFDKTGPKEVDAPGLLSICINSSFIEQQIEKIQHFRDVRDIRNKTLHEAQGEMDGKKADDCLKKMLNVLEDQNELKHDTYAQQAAYHIRKIIDKTERTPVYMNELLHKWLLTNNLDVDEFLKVVEEWMIDKRRKEDLIGDLRQRLAIYYNKRLNHAPISPLMSDKDEKLVKIYVPPKIFERNPRKIGAAEKEKGTLVTSYRHLIWKNGKFGDHVFIVGEAGIGKSSCAAMCALKWANQFSSTNTINEPDINDSHLSSIESAELEELIQSNSDLKLIFPPKTKLDERFQDGTFFKKVEFLFHLTLRDCCHLCDITNMIQDQLINTIYTDDERSTALSTLHSVLYNKKCVIIVDGLDEWTHPNETNYRCSEGDKVIPHLAPNNDATVLITSRPWRMSHQRVKDSSIDTYLEIEGTTDMRSLLQKTINSLNETVTEKKTLPDFVRFIKRMNIVRLLSVPIISMLLVCLWFEGMHESMSLCEIYAYIIDMMFGRKTLPVLTVSQENIPFPRCFDLKEHVQKYYNIVMELAKLAFTTLFSNDQSSSLVFKKVDVMTHDHLLFVLKSGILQETKSSSLIEKSSSYSFIHKTVQDFLAAIYMSHHTRDFHSVVKPFYKNSTDIADVLQVFIFLCGLNIELANELSAMISDRPSNSEEQIPPEVRAIFSGYVEAQANEVTNIHLSLCRFDYPKFGNPELLNDLLLKNKYKVQFIDPDSKTNETTLREVFICSKDTLTNVTLCGLSERYDLTACNCLQHLRIFGPEMMNIVVNTKHLVSLTLHTVSESVQRSILKSLQSKSEKLKIFRVENMTNISLFDETLPQLKHLENLDITIANLSEQTLPLLPASLTYVHLYQVKMTARSLMELIKRLEKNTHSVKCLLQHCTVQPNIDYANIKRYIQRNDKFDSEINGNEVSFRLNSKKQN